MKKLIGCAMIALTAGGTFALEQMSPYDDAAYWFRGGVDLNEDGIYGSGSYEFRDVTHAANATHANHVMKLNQSGTAYEPLKACTGTVIMPHAGQVLTDAPYLHLPQRVETNGTFISEAGVEYPIVKLHANYIDLPNFLSNLPSGQACTNYTVFLRFRDHSRVSDRQSEHNLFQLGYSWATGPAGLSMAVSHQGSYFTPKPYFGSNIQGIDSIDGFKFKYGQWHDLAVIVKDGGKTVEFAAAANVSESPVTNKVFAYTKLTPVSGTTPAITSARRWGHIGGESSGISGTYTNGYSGGTHNDPALGNKAKCFRGDIQTFAFWSRALTTNEIRQVFSERRPAVIRMGLANGSSDEFLGTDDGTADANGFHPEAWNPVLNPDHPSTTVKFTVVDGEQGVGQYLRIRPVPGSATAVLTIKVDGSILTTQRVSGSDDTLLYVNSSYMTSGQHTISFERKDGAEENFTIDAFLLAGSWRVGNTANSHGGMSHESVNDTGYPHQYANPRRFPLTDGNMNHFARGFSGGPGGDNGKHYIPFTIPADIYEKMTDATLTLGFAGGAANLSVFVNGTEIKTFSGFDSAGSVTCTIPVANLVAGENELMVHQTSGSWLNCCRYMLELGPMPAEVKTLDADDPHADAEIWWRGTDMKTADGTANKASLYNSATGETLVPTVAGTANDVQIRTEQIFCPYRHRATTGKAIYFAQPTWTNEETYADGSTTNFLHVRSSRLDFSNIFSNLAVPLSNYTVQVRFRVDESPSRWNGTQRWMIRTGFEWGGNCGLAFGLTADNSTDLGLVCNSGQTGFTPSAGTTTSRANSWNDVIISVKDAKTIKTVFCAENGYPRSGTFNVSAANAYIKKGGVFQIGTEDTTSDAKVVLGKVASATCWKCFRGSIAEVAFWRRTLTEAEMRAALGNPLPGIFRLGVDNGLTSEFTGTEPATEYDADNDTLAAAAPVLKADSPEVTVKAYITQMNATLPQVLRLKPTMEFGGTATLKLYVNGREAGDPVEVKPDAFSCFSVRPTYYRANATNEFRLVRTDAGRNTLTVDMIDLVGSWDLGGPEGGNIYFSHEQQAPVDYYVSNGRWMSLVRGVTASNKENPAFRIHFTVPKGFANEYDYRYDFRLSDGTGSSDAESAKRVLFKVVLNGEPVWSTVTDPTTNPALRPYIIDLANEPIRIPAGSLHEGDNTIEVYALPNSPSGMYQSFCRHRLRLVQSRVGAMLILK